MWTFDPSLTCWIVPDAIGCDLHVDTDTARYCRERFSDPTHQAAGVSKAIARAKQLVAKLASRDNGGN